MGDLNWKKWLLSLSLPLLFLLMWEYGVDRVPRLLFVLPTPSSIFKTLWEMKERFLFHTLLTLKEMCFGFLIALSLAFPLAWTMMRYQMSRSFLQPLFIIIQCIPMFTLAPLMVIWFGWGPIAIIIPTALMIFFPLTLSIYQGLRSTPQDLLELFEANQATGFQTFVKLRLPWALPHIFAGFRISAAIAGVSAIAGEWAGAQNGLGVLMLESRRNTDLEITFGALFCLTILSCFLYLLVLYAEKITLFHRQFKKLLLAPFYSKKSHLIFPLIALLAISFLGCHQKVKEAETKLLLDWLPNPNHIPLYVGMEQGYFKEVGIELKIQKMEECGGSIGYLVAKKADLLINHMPGTLKACERGAQLKIIGSLIKEPLCGLIYREDATIKIPSDLSGRSFGYCIGLPDIDFLDFLLESGKIHPSDKKNVSVDLVASLGTKSVDFIYGGFWNIEPAQLAALGIETKTFKIQELGVPIYYEMIILANADSPFATPSYVKKFQQALQKSIDFCKAQPEEAFSIYLQYNCDRSCKTNGWQKEAWLLTYPLLAEDQTIDNQLVKDFYFWQLSHGIIKQPFDFRNLIKID